LLQPNVQQIPHQIIFHPYNMATVQELSTDIKSSAVLQETFGDAADSARY
jgi:hypothetical protein